MDGEIFESGKKKLGIQNSDPDTCGQGLKDDDKTFKFQQTGDVFIPKLLKGNYGRPVLFWVVKLFKATVEPRYNERPSRGLANYIRCNEVSCIEFPFIHFYYYFMYNNRAGVFSFDYFWTLSHVFGIVATDFNFVVLPNLIEIDLFV